MVSTPISAGPVDAGDGVQIVNAAVGPPGPYGFVFWPFRDVLTILVYEDPGAADHTAGHASMGGIPFALNRDPVEGFPSHLVGPFKAPGTEVPCGKPSRLIQDIDENVCSVRGQPLTGYRIFLKRLGKAFGRLVEGLFVNNGSQLAP